MHTLNLSTWKAEISLIYSVNSRTAKATWRKPAFKQHINKQTKQTETQRYQTAIRICQDPVCSCHHVGLSLTWDCHSILPAIPGLLEGSALILKCQL